MDFEKIKKEVEPILEGITQFFEEHQDSSEADKIVITLYKNAFDDFVNKLHKKVTMKRIENFMNKVYNIDSYLFSYISCLMAYSEDHKGINEVIRAMLVGLGKYLEELIDSDKLEDDEEEEIEEDAEEWETTGESFTMEDFEDDED